MVVKEVCCRIVWVAHKKICVIKNVFFLSHRKGPGKYIYRTVKQVVGSEGVGALNVLC